MVIDQVRDRDDPLYLSEQHSKSTRALVVRLENIRQERRVSSGSSCPQGKRDRARDMAEFYRIACLIYLEIVAMNFVDPPASSKVQERVQTAFELLDKLRVCERPFPLFVLALEARIYRQRYRVLQVIEETIKDRPFCAHFISLKRMVEAAWVQDDLNSGGPQELDALLKYNAVISANRVAPAFI
jgi:hypothetical protein